MEGGKDTLCFLSPNLCFTGGRATGKTGDCRGDPAGDPAVRGKEGGNDTLCFLSPNLCFTGGIATGRGTGGERRGDAAGDPRAVRAEEEGGSDTRCFLSPNQWCRLPGLLLVATVLVRTGILR